jgi:Fe-S-cluster containining protein
MTDEILKKPVHIAILKESYMQELQRRGKLDKTPVSLESPEVPPLPREEKVKPQLQKVPKVPAFTKQANIRTKLRVLYDRVPPLPADKVPDCSNCVAACCSAFVVTLTEEEYQSGLFSNAAVKITPEMTKQFRGGAVSALSALLAPNFSQETDKPQYLLEGKVGEPCPFLNGTKCGIYEDRPLVCRTYTCVGDDRITPEMKAGTEDAFTFGRNIKG